MRLLTTIILLASSWAALAQDKDPQPAGPDVDRERAERQVGQMEGLELSEAQRARLVEQLAIQSWRGRRDGVLRKVGLNPRDLDALELSDAQRADSERVLDDIGRRLFQRFESGDQWSMAEWRAYLITMRTETDQRIGKLLEGEQRAAWETITAKHRAAAKASYQKWGQWDGSVKGNDGKAKAKGDKAAKPESAEAEIRRLLAAALKALALGDEEAKVVRDPLLALIRHKVLGRRALAARRAKLQAIENPAEAALKGYREARQRYQTRLAPLEAAVRQLLTVLQEARLVGLDILS